jgi:hypothetical protein
LRRAVVSAVKEGKNGKLTVSKYDSAAIIAQAEYKLGKGRL